MEPSARLALYHSVGASDAIEDSDIRKPTDDGLPETLSGWIRYNGLTHIKIKLAGDDLEWDLDRVVRIDRTTTEVQTQRRVITWAYSLDFNERCPNVGYLLEFLRRLKEKAPQGFEKIRYIEQPTARDLEKHRENTMHEAAKLRPVVIDESLTGLDRLMLARELGYTGVALKACKGHSQALLMAAARRIPRTLGWTRGARAGRDGSRGECPAVRADSEQGLAGEVPRSLPCQGWNDSHHEPKWTWSGSTDIDARHAIPLRNRLSSPGDGEDIAG